MQVRHAIWRVGGESTVTDHQQIGHRAVAGEDDLIVLSEQWMIIGPQENTLDKGRIDLLAIARMSR